MLADIARQGSVLASLLARRAELEDFCERHLRPGPGGRTFAFGSGDGWFAARAALFDRPGTVAVSGLDFVLRVAPQLGPADRALAISMSGNVDRTVEAARAALEAGVPTAVLTNGSGGRLGDLGCPPFSLGLDDLAPFLCGTASYTATLAALSLAADALSRSNEFAAALEAFLPDFDALFAAADEWASGIAASCPGCPGVRLLATGRGLATAEFGAAKIVEVTTVPVWSDDIEEFAHRQYWSMRRGELVVLLPHDSGSAAYADAAAAALGELATPVAALGPGPLVPNAQHRLDLPGGTQFAALTQAVALQLLAYRLGLANGTDPNRRAHLKADQTRFAVSRKLTRRSLLGTGA